MFVLEIEDEGLVCGAAAVACGGLRGDEEVGYYEGVVALGVSMY